MRGRIATLLAFVLAAGPLAARAQSLTLTGLDGQTQTLAAADIAALPHEPVTLTLDGGRTQACSGVPLALLLQRVGAPSGKAIKGPELADVVVIGAADGYRVAVALAETDALFRTEKVILADACDGAPLPATQGPYRLVVEGDKRPARSARMVTSITLRRVQ
jgi:hypothetical protein